MKTIPELDLGFRDAVNYRNNENKELFNRIFLRTPELEKLFETSTNFLLGEKGTGKTAYAVFLSNMEYKNHVSSIKYLHETEYEKFVAMKKRKNLDLSGYTSIWKVIIYLLLAQQIREKDNNILHKFNIFNALAKAIDEFYNSAFSPEIVNAIQFAEEASVSAKLLSAVANIGAKGKTSTAYSESNFQLNLLYIQRQFEKAFRTLKLDNHFLLFIDGVDVRPVSINYDVYIDCIKGLANAVWTVNNDFFSTIKDSPGRLKVVLLMRPDIFNTLGLHNQNSKIRDNSVILNWRTTYKSYRTSPLFQMADRLLAVQQDKVLQQGEAWDYYFPYDTSKLISHIPSPTSFISFLRYSLYRPRNVLAILSIHKELFIEQGRNNKDTFRYRDFTDPSFTRNYSDYLLGEVRDHISFYYDQKSYEILIKFFQFLNGKSFFSYEEYLSAFDNHVEFLQRNSMSIPSFCNTPDIFLQFLYDLNILGYVVKSNDGQIFFGWCNRDRSPSNIAPKVRTNVSYKIHFGLMKALDLGKLFNIDENIAWEEDDTDDGMF